MSIKQKDGQRGFGHVLLFVMIAFVIGLAGFAAYGVMQDSKKDNKTADTSTDTGDKENDDTQQAKCDADVPLDSAKGAFDTLPFDIVNVKLITLGKETGDARFVYPWVKTGAVKIYAPADGVLYKIRHQVYEAGGKQGNDYDIFFRVSCDTAYRFNHISNPRSDIKAAYPAGDLPSGDYANGGQDIAERVKPTSALRVKAGDLLGTTTGTPDFKHFDFGVGVAKKDGEKDQLYSVCAFSVFNEPHKSTLSNMLGPKGGLPTPGYPCDVPSEKF
jgi:hypothetical protein